jgi:hypothetical protein
VKVFLSWSGASSHEVAKLLYSWLPMLIQRIDPYISSEIDKGTRWSTDIARELESSSFGIACVTQANKDAPWLLFEAGALSKSVAEGRLAPLLCGIEQADIQKSPISQFQMTKFERGEFLRLLHSMNSALGDDALDSKVLDGLFDALWPRLEEAISQVLAKEDADKAISTQVLDSDRIMGAIEELITSSRATSQMLSRPDKILPPEYVRSVIGLRHSGERANFGDSEFRKIFDLVAKSRAFLDDVRCEDDDDRALVNGANDNLKEIMNVLRDTLRKRNTMNHHGHFVTFIERDREVGGEPPLTEMSG